MEHGALHNAVQTRSESDLEQNAMLVNLTISTTLRPSVLHQTANGESRSAGEGRLNLTQEVMIVGFVEQESEIGSTMEGVRALPKGSPRLSMASGGPTRRFLQTVEKVPGILLAFQIEQMSQVPLRLVVEITRQSVESVFQISRHEKWKVAYPHPVDGQLAYP